MWIARPGYLDSDERRNGDADPGPAPSVKLLRAGELTSVWVPDESHEAIRDLGASTAAIIGRPQRPYPPVRTAPGLVYTSCQIPKVTLLAHFCCILVHVQVDTYIVDGKGRT